MSFGGGAAFTNRGPQLFAGPIAFSLGTTFSDVIVAGRRAAVYGGAANILGSDFSWYTAGPPAVVAAPVNVNRPWAGRYPWYHGGWAGWGAWPSGWGGANGDRVGFYSNPYVGVVPGAASSSGRVPLELSPELRAALDYRRPIQRVPQEVSPEVVEAAQARLEAGRTAFKRGNYKEGLAQAERGITLLPGDANMHEFRALGLFALGRYAEAAQAVHAVLSAEPGWNWETMRSFYTNKDNYTKQLRDLEEHVGFWPEDAAARFLLAYHYLVLDERDAALEQLREVVRLEPDDRLSAALVEALEKGRKRARGRALPGARGHGVGGRGIGERGA